LHRTGAVAQAVEHLPRKHKALSCNPSIAHTKKVLAEKEIKIALNITKR
jgi:hypothetical protein